MELIEKSMYCASSTVDNLRSRGTHAVAVVMMDVSKWPTLLIVDVMHDRHRQRYKLYAVPTLLCKCKFHSKMKGSVVPACPLFME